MSLITNHNVEVNVFQLVEMTREHFVGYEKERNMLGIDEIVNFMLGVDLECVGTQLTQPFFYFFVPILNQRTGSKNLEEKKF